MPGRCVDAMGETDKFPAFSRVDGGPGWAIRRTRVVCQRQRERCQGKGFDALSDTAKINLPLYRTKHQGREASIFPDDAYFYGIDYI